MPIDTTAGLKLIGVCHELFCELARAGLKKSERFVIKLSRHVKNNMRFYGISKNDIQKTVELPDKVEKEGEKMIAIKNFQRRFSGFPLKVVYEEIGDQLFVITAYPLKKKMWR